MSNTSMIIEERSRDIGAFMVGRLLPFRKKRMVGPFIFIDHMGPTTLGKGQYMDVDRHPHTGLATLTYLLDGVVMHRDSLGTSQRITPGSVNLMVAGKGVTHTERTPEDWRDGREFVMHGYQIWIALPKEDEFCEPHFQHCEAASLPRWEHDGIRYSLVAGEAFGRQSPVTCYSPLYLVDIEADMDGAIDLGDELFGELGICVVKGSVYTDHEEIQAGHMLVAKHERSCSLRLDAGTRILIFGGEPFPEERFIHWNFVASHKQTLEAAKKAWMDDDFPKIEGDSSYVPLPGA